jgi:hypothetical protein
VKRVAWNLFSMTSGCAQPAIEPNLMVGSNAPTELATSAMLFGYQAAMLTAVILLA